MTQRLDPEQRKRMIVQAAIKIAKERGLQHVNHSAVAKRCPLQTSTSTVRHYFTTQIDLQTACVIIDDSLTDAAKELGVI